MWHCNLDRNNNITANCDKVEVQLLTRTANQRAFSLLHSSWSCPQRVERANQPVSVQSPGKTITSSGGSLCFEPPNSCHGLTCLRRRLPANAFASVLHVSQWATGLQAHSAQVLNTVSIGSVILCNQNGCWNWHKPLRRYSPFRYSSLSLELVETSSVQIFWHLSCPVKATFHRSGTVFLRDPRRSTLLQSQTWLRGLTSLRRRCHPAQLCHPGSLCLPSEPTASQYGSVDSCLQENQQETT